MNQLELLNRLAGGHTEETPIAIALVSVAGSHLIALSERVADKVVLLEVTNRVAGIDLQSGFWTLFENGDCRTTTRQELTDYAYRHGWVDMTRNPDSEANREATETPTPKSFRAVRGVRRILERDPVGMILRVRFRSSAEAEQCLSMLTNMPAVLELSSRVVST